MAMQNGLFEGVFPIENGDVPLPCLVFWRVPSDRSITLGCNDLRGKKYGILHGISSGMHHDRVISDTKKLRFQTAPADLLQCLMLQSKGGVHCE